MTKYIVPGLLLLAAYAFTFMNGYNDGGNVVATIVASRSMTQRRALALSAAVEALSPLFFGGAVAATIGRNIVPDKYYMNAPVESAYAFIGAGLVSAIAWSIAAQMLRFPSSSSHALIGGIFGAGVPAFGVHAVDWVSLLVKVVLVMFLAPIISFFTSGFLMGFMRRLARRPSPFFNSFLRTVQKINLGLLAAMHSANDSGKSIGVVMLILAISKLLPAQGSAPLYITLSSSVVLALGVFLSGTRIIKTVGLGIYKVKPIHSFTSQLSSSIVLAVAGFIGSPVSASHIVSSSIMGVGSVERFTAVRWGTVKRILLSWLVTMPATALLGGLLYMTFELIFV